MGNVLDGMRRNAPRGLDAILGECESAPDDKGGQIRTRRKRMQNSV